MNRHAKEEIELANKHIKYAQNTIREMQMKTPMRYYHTLIRMVNILNIISRAGDYTEQLELSCTTQGNEWSIYFGNVFSCTDHRT